jgi:hypothetical protein
MPFALKVFLWSLFSGTAIGGLSFKLILYFGQRWAGGDQEREIIVGILAVLGALAMGVAGAVSAGVVAGKKARS